MRWVAGTTSVLAPHLSSPVNLFLASDFRGAPATAPARRQFFEALDGQVYAAMPYCIQNEWIHFVTSRRRAGACVSNQLWLGTEEAFKKVGSRGVLVVLLQAIGKFWAHTWHSVKVPHGYVPWFLSLLRPLRVLLFPKAHVNLGRLYIQGGFLSAAALIDQFHHLNHAHYLCRSLTLSQRVRFASAHYDFEFEKFDVRYKRAVYLGDGLLLWSEARDGVEFSVRLLASSRARPEGDLRVCLFVGTEPLYNINFSWLRDQNTPPHAMPFICRSQGRWRKDTATLAAFDQAYPNNSGAFFAYAAIQGLALAVGARQILGIRGTNQVCFEPRDGTPFANAYDAFWAKLGGADAHELGYLIPVPFPQKPLSEVPAKHRKRSAQRREHWAAIEHAARHALVTRMGPIEAAEICGCARAPKALHPGAPA